MEMFDKSNASLLIETTLQKLTWRPYILLWAIECLIKEYTCKAETNVSDLFLMCLSLLIASFMSKIDNKV